MGYFNLDESNNALIADMAEQWECDLSQMNEPSRLWLIARIANEAWQQEPSGKAPTSPAEQTVERLNELSYHEKIGLLQTLCQ